MLLAFRLPIALAVAFALVPAGTAFAADPTTEECVAANEKSGPLLHAGKLREARASLLHCSAASCPGVVRDDCIKGATQAEAAVPTIVFEAKDAAGNDLSDVRVTMDGEALAGQLTGTAIEVDPGEHVFAFETAGQTVQKRLIVHQGEKNRREPIAFGAPAPARSSHDAPAETTPGSEGKGLGSQRILAIGAGAVGVTGVIAGSVLGLLASSRWQQAKNECGAGCAPGTPAQDDASSAHSMATLANISFAVGAVGLATGAILWVLSPQAKPATALRVAPFVERSGAGVAAAWSLP
jgi:hypothetical protein